MVAFSAPVSRRSRTGLTRVALLAAFAVATIQGSGRAFSAVSGGMDRKQAKSQLKTRGNLKPQVLEIPLEEAAEEAPPAEPMPEYRIPYTLHMVTQFPNHKHLQEESSARKYLEQKLTGALENVDSLVKHVEFRLAVEENFHKEKDGHKKVVEAPVTARETSDGSIVEDVNENFGKTGAKVLAPYKIKVVVSMKQGKEVIYSNPEKHAEHTLTEAADSMADGLKRLLRDEKEKDISNRRHQKGLRELLLTGSEGLDEEFPVTDTIGEAEDAEMEALYEKIEATSDDNN